jgi:hypothetical protein
LLALTVLLEAVWKSVGVFAAAFDNMVSAWLVDARQTVCSRIEPSIVGVMCARPPVFRARSFRQPLGKRSVALAQVALARADLVC